MKKIIKNKILNGLFNSNQKKMQNTTRQNQTLNLKEILLANMLTASFGGGTLSTYVIVPMNIMGTLFNSISILIFFKKSFRTIALFKYMKIFTLSSLIINAAGIFGFYFNVSQLFDLAISYAARIFRCYILPSYVLTFFFFYSNVIDVIINIERAVNFSNKYQWFKRTSPYLISFFLLIICVFINLPNYFLYDIVQDKDIYVRLRLCVSSAFIQTTLGKVTQITSYVIQGPILLVLEVVTNVLSLISFKNYLKRKSATTRVSNKNLNKKQIKQQRKIEKMEQKLLWMTTYMTGFSCIMHIIQLTAQIIIFYIGTNPILSSVLIFLYSFIISLNHSMNIFFYYFFNINFRKELKICKITSTSEE